ncbi:MAG: site-specific integrase [Anaerolineales bacterium]|nr:site-specific integrase [Anaerolineales bacterium]
MSQITRFDIDNYCVSLPVKRLSRSTLRSYVKSLKQFWRWCHEYKLVVENITGHLSTPSENQNRRIKAMTTANFDAMVEACHILRDRTILSFMGDTGVRPIELINLRVDHLNLEALEAYVYGKTRTFDNPRLVDYSAATRDLLCLYLEERPDVDHPFVFVKLLKPHDQITYCTLRMIFRRLSDRAGVKTNGTAKSIRHLVGQRFTVERNLELARQKLGHSHIKTTMVYANIDRSLVKQATADLSFVDRNLEE